MTDSAVSDRSKPTRRRLDPELSRTMILDAAERLMRRDGYAAVSSRRVAAEAGLKPPLVHYYYATTDDLLLAVYERSARISEGRLMAAFASDRPLRALWEMHSDPERAALAAEFVAMANHRKTIGVVIGRTVTRSRSVIVGVFEQALKDAPAAGMAGIDPVVAAMLLASISYALVLEGQIGITAGHAAARGFVEAMIDRIEPPR